MISARPRQQPRFGGSKRHPDRRLCPAGSWLRCRRDLTGKPVSEVPRDAHIRGCAPPAFGYALVETFICWLRPQIIMHVCCACDLGDGPRTCMQSCGEAPGCGVQLLDWADPRARTTRPTPGAPTRRTEYRRQGRERPLGVDASKLIRLACSMWPVRMLAESDAGKRNLVGELSARR